MKLVAVGRNRDGFFLIHAEEGRAVVEARTKFNYYTENGFDVVQSVVTHNEESAIKLFAKCITRILYTESAEVEKKICEYGGKIRKTSNYFFEEVVRRYAEKFSWLAFDQRETFDVSTNGEIIELIQVYNEMVDWYLAAGGNKNALSHENAEYVNGIIYPTCDKPAHKTASNVVIITADFAEIYKYSA